MNINASITPTAGKVSGKVLFVIYAADAPNTPVDHKEYDPSPLPLDWTFADKPWKTYIVNTYDSPGWPSLGILLQSWIFQKDRDKDVLLDPTYLFMDAPAVGTQTFTDVDLFADGREIAWIERGGFGELYPAFDVNYIDNGFELLAEGDTFQPGERFVIHWKNQTVQADIISPTSGGGGFTKDKLITADYTVILDDNNTLILASPSSPITVTLPSLSSFPNFGIIGINCYGSVVNVLSVGADKLVTPNRLNGVYLHGHEQVVIMKSPSINQWVMTSVSDAIYRTGRIIDQYSLYQEVPYILANGALLNREDYPRLWGYVSDNTDIRVDESTWNTGTANKGKYSTGDGNTTFRVPLLYLNGFVKGIDGVSRTSGSFESAAFPEHTHLLVKKANGNGTVDANSSLLYSKDNGQSNGYILAGTTDEPDALKSGKAGSGTDNRPANIGVYKLICI